VLALVLALALASLPAAAAASAVRRVPVRVSSGGGASADSTEAEEGGAEVGAASPLASPAFSNSKFGGMLTLDGRCIIGTRRLCRLRARAEGAALVAGAATTGGIGAALVVLRGSAVLGASVTTPKELIASIPGAVDR
jgi:hypothetical protein